MNTSNNIFDAMDLPRTIEADNQFYDMLYGHKPDRSNARIEYQVIVTVNDVPVYTTLQHDTEAIETRLYNMEQAVDNELKQLQELETYGN